MPDVSVLVVSYNTAEHLRRCLASALHEPSRAEREVIVADNASGDGSPDLVRAEFPEATLIETGSNLGFAAAVNVCAKAATGRYLLLLNSDAVLAPGALDELVQFADTAPRNGIYGGRIVDERGHVDYRSCWGLPSAWSMFCFGVGLSSAFPRNRRFDPESLGRWDRSSVREVGAISGGFMLIERGLFERLGGLDEAYFMYSEDIDFCARARALGYRPVVVPSATATHAVGASSTRVGKTVLVLKGKATFVRRNWSGPRRAWGCTMLWLGALVRATGARVAGGERGKVWREVWARRAEWLRGYDEPRPIVNA